MTTIYGNNTETVAPFTAESEFQTSTAQAQGLTNTMQFSLTESTDFISMSAAVRLNSGGAGT